MCGIVGYIGNRNAQPILINGLSKLEYRGYDSAGIAVHDGSVINITKAKGRLIALQEKLEGNELIGNIGIGHTRWATHGEPSDVNSHPQSAGRISVVHNGIIENYLELKAQLKDSLFSSDTDTEIVAHLIETEYKTKSVEGMLNAIYETMKRLTGSYAIVVMCSDFPDMLFAMRKDNPLIIGLGENENFITSDITAIIEHTRDTYILNDNEVATVTSNSVKVYDKDMNELQKEIFEVNWDVAAAKKDGYEFFMLKEIFEQPRIVNDFLSANTNDILKSFRPKRIYIVGCGTAYHAGLIGLQLLSCIPDVFVTAEVASEFRYSNPVIDNDTLLIVISQSGETADTLAALRMAKRNGAYVLAMVNVMGSSIARDADEVIYMLAGPEVSVASTKAFTAQVVAMYSFVLRMYELFDMADAKMIDDLKLLPELIEQILARDSEILALAKKYVMCKNVFYIGRGLDYCIALEGSLKLKEIAYLYSQAFAAGELKHGPIALLEDSILVIGIATQSHVIDKTVSNLKECKSRNAKILTIATKKNHAIDEVSDDVFYIPDVNSTIAPVLANIPLQLFAYHIANLLGYDIDKPRNLAKSVTVE